MKVEITVATYENIDGEEPAKVVVKSHWNWDNFATITVNGQSAVVNRRELAEALNRAGCKD
jgi:hypothetical protein